MSKTSHHSPKALEVMVMFEPHRLPHDLLQTAYALLVPLSRRRLPGAQPSKVPPQAQPQERGEGSVS